jgi:hypothetical protein
MERRPSTVIYCAAQLYTVRETDIALDQDTYPNLLLATNLDVSVQLQSV